MTPRRQFEAMADRMLAEARAEVLRRFADLEARSEAFHAADRTDFAARLKHVCDEAVEARAWHRLRYRWRLVPAGLR